MTTSSPPPAGQEGKPVIPNQTLYRRIGRGSYGEVWLATDVMQKWRAVKIVSRKEEDHAGRGYEREFKALDRYEEVCHLHGSLMPILAVGRDPADRFFYYSMELADDARTNKRLETSNVSPEQAASMIEGYRPRTLRSELQARGRLPPAECVELGIALATALEQLHRHRLIHRDIKPENIIFVHGLPKLADIGLVADVQATYSLAGTDVYLAPEAPRKEPADIFALGKVLYEMVSGRDVGEFPAVAKDFDRLSQEERVAINELNAVVFKACDWELKERQASAKDLREELELLQKGGSVQRLRRLEQATKLLWRTVVLLVALALLAGGVFAYHSLRARAVEEGRRRELREVQISRLEIREAGWFTNAWRRIEHAAAIRKDRDLMEQASSLLSGFDARAVAVLRGVAAASAVFAPDGRALLGGVGASPTILMDTNGSWTELAVRGEGPVCWPPDGVPLELTAMSNRLVLREALTGKVRREFAFSGANHLIPDPGRTLAMTADGGLIAAAVGNRLVVWRAGTGERVATIEARATSLAFSPDGALLAAGGEDGTTRVYAMPSLAEVAVLPPALRGNPITCLAFSRDRLVRQGRASQTNSWLLATGDQGAGIVIWDLDRRLPRSFCRGSTWTVTALAFAPDGLTLASAGRNYTLLWDVVSGRPLLRLAAASSGDSRALAFDATGRHLVCGGEAGASGAVLAQFELEPHRGMQVLRGLGSPVRKVWFSADGARMAALSDDWHLAVWEVGSADLRFLFEVPVGNLADNAGGCFGAKGGQFAFAAGTQACLFDLASGNTPQRWRLADGFEDQLQFDARGRLLLLRRERPVAEKGWRWRLYELGPSEAPSLVLKQTETNWFAQYTALAPGGGRFLVANWPSKGAPRMVQAYDVADGRELWQAPVPNNFRVCFDPTGREFGYNAYADGRLCLVRLADFAVIGTTPTAYDSISPSGNEFAASGWFFPRRTGIEQAIPLGPDWRGSGWACAFSPNGRLLARGTEEGAVLVADLPEVVRRLSSLR